MEFRVNIEKVCDFMGISLSEFDNMTISQVMEVKNQMKKADILERRIDVKMMERYRNFFIDYKVFVSYFGETMVDKHLPIIPIEKLIEKEYVRKGEKCHKRKAVFIGEINHYFPVRSGRGSRSGHSEIQSADIYEVPASYQNLLHKDIVLSIFREKYLWAIDFDLSIYGIHETKKNHEFYVETECGNSLYVPYTDFIKGDVEAIELRNEKYLKANNNAQYEGKDTYLELIETPTAVKFLELVATHNK